MDICYFDKYSLLSCYVIYDIEPKFI